MLALWGASMLSKMLYRGGGGREGGAMTEEEYEERRKELIEGHHAHCRRVIYDPSSSPCTCAQEWQADYERLAASFPETAKERDRLRAQRDKLYSALKMLLPVAQAFERQASKGTGGRRGGPVFEQARAALAEAAPEKEGGG